MDNPCKTDVHSKAPENGAIYEGDFKNDKSHGHGVFTYANGDKYTGDYKDDKRHGKGKYFYKSGAI